MRENLKYQNASGSADLARASAPSIANFYTSVDAALAALNTGGACAVFEEYYKPSECNYARATLGLSMAGSDGQTMAEQTFLVTFCSLDGKDGVRLERIATITWTCGTTAIPTAVGGRSGHYDAKLVSLTDDGLLLARVGVAPLTVSREPACVELPDLGDAAGVLRVIYKTASGAATGAAPLITRWR